MIKFKFSEEILKHHDAKKVVEGYRIAQQIVNNPFFSAEILKIKKLTYTKDSVDEIYCKVVVMKEVNVVTIPIELYWYRNSRVIGMTKGDGKIYVNLNGVKDRISGDYLENALHELGHYPFGYGHGSNFPNGWRARLMGDFADKNFSVPYHFARIGKEIYKKIL